MEKEDMTSWPYMNDVSLNMRNYAKNIEEEGIFYREMPLYEKK